MKKDIKLLMFDLKNDVLSSSKDTLMRKVIKEFLFMMIICSISMVIGAMFIPPQYAIFAGIGSIVVLILAVFVRAKGGLAVQRGVYYFVSFLLGISSYPTILYYISDVGAGIVLLAFGITTVVFTSLSLFSYFSKKDFTFLGSMLFIALISLLIVSVVGIFIQSEFLNLALAWAGVIIFSGYILVDISLIKKNFFNDEDVPMLAFNLFLDFLNLFMDILRIIAYIKKKD